MDYEKEHNIRLESMSKPSREELVASARKIYNRDCEGYWPSGELKKALLEEFPELAESEDERIRKEIVTYLSNELHNVKQLTPRTNTIEDWIAWLEKIKNSKVCEGNGKNFTISERKSKWKPLPESLEALMYAVEGKWEMIKPTNYLSRRLEDLYEGLVNTFNIDETYLKELSKAASAGDIEGLRALKRKIDASIEQKPEEEQKDHFIDANKKVQMPAEWSEEDKNALSGIYEVLGAACTLNVMDAQTCHDMKRWLLEKFYSLCNRPKPSDVWKPSEEQMFSLDNAIIMFHNQRRGGDKERLESLYNDLKKL